MTKEETIKVLQSIEDRAVDFPYMTACDWVAIAVAKRHLENSIEVKKVNFGTEVYKYIDEHFNVYDDGNQTLQTKDKKTLIGRVDVENIAKHFFELGMLVSNLVTAADSGMVEEIIVNLKRVEQDYHIDLTKEMEWLRNLIKKENSYDRQRKNP